jgi:Fe-S cluster assembly ATP-binding protein
MDAQKKPIMNLADVPLRESRHGETFAAQLGRIGPLIGAKKLGCQLHIVPPRKKAFPRHAHHANEEMFFVLSGTGQFRIGEETHAIRAGDVIAALSGDGSTAHQIVNTSDEELGLLGAKFVYIGRAGDALNYWDNEEIGMLEIKNLHAETGGKQILRGLDLTVPKGEVHAIMGPNGSGKSTLAYVLAGKDDYEVTEGSITWNGENLLEMEPDERAHAGVFLAFQYPMEIPGVASMTFLRTAVNALRKARGEAELSTPDFLRLVRAQAAKLSISFDMLKRPVNTGFSGGEKKRHEILQMALLQPSLCVLDETDSGLDIDAVRIVSEGVNALRSPDRAFLLITHYQRLLNYIVPDKVHVMAHGRIVRSGGKELALELEKSGYAEYGDGAAAA